MKFKKLIILFIIILSICILPSCAETPDEPVTDNPPSENPPIEDPPSEDPPIDENPPEETPPEDNPTEEEEIIQIGMPIHKVVSRLGAATQSDLIPTVYYWDTGDDKLLYVWFDNTLRVEKFERRYDIIEVGMTYSEVCDLLDKKGRRVNDFSRVYLWEQSNDKKLYVWFNEPSDASYSTENLTVKRYNYLDDISFREGMTYDEVVFLLGKDGSPINHFQNVYKWDSESGEDFYVWFDDDDTTDLTVVKTQNLRELKISAGLSYSDVSELFCNAETRKISIDQEIYSWKTGNDEIGIFEFSKNSQGELALSNFEYANNISYIGKSYDEICEALGSTGELYEHEYAKSTIYHWDSVLDADLFVVLNDEMVAEKFSFETDIKTDVGSSYEMFKFVFGERKYGAHSIKYSRFYPDEWKVDDFFSATWETKGAFDMQVTVSYETRKITEILYDVPRIDLNNHMTFHEIVYETLGEEYFENTDYVNSKASYSYYRHYGEYDLCLEFTSGTVVACCIFFKKCEGHEEKTE